MSGVDWSYFNRFEAIEDKYLPPTGEGETMATQIVTAVTKIVYKWYNDGDVYDNTYGLEGWANDLSSYANWLRKYTDAGEILDKVWGAYTDDDYEHILKELADHLLTDELDELNNKQAVGSIYKADGPYRFEEEQEEDEDEYEDEY